MTVARRLLIHAALGAGIVIAVVAWVTYQLVFDAAEERAIEHLNTYVKERTKREEANFQTIYSNLEVVRGQFLKRDKEPVFSDAQARWDKRFELYPDGAWRSREKYYSPRVYSNLWLHKNYQLTPQYQTRILRAQEICEDVQPGWIDSFQSVYFIFPGPATMGFDPRIPRWSWQTPGDYDLDQEEWVKETSPARNPSRTFVWTGVFVDPPTSEPFVTVQLPVDKDGEQIATVAHDMHINQLFNEITKSEFTGATHLIFRPDGRLIVHPKLKDKILASNGALTAESSGDAVLASLYKVCVAKAERQFSGVEPVSGGYFSASRLPSAEWFFVTLMPRDVVRGQAVRSAKWVWLSGSASLALLFVILAAILRRQVSRPLAELTTATRQMAAERQGPRIAPVHDDELGELVRTFNDMEEKTRARTTALRASEQRWRALIEQSPLSVQIFEPDGRTLVVNRAFEKLWGTTLEMLAGHSVFQDARFEAAGVLPAIRRAFEGHVVEVPAARYHAAGPPGAVGESSEEKWLSALLYPLHDDAGALREVICIYVDITERKRAEDQVLALNQSLEQRVAKRTEELYAALARERELGQLRANFVSLVSHEFRTPLEIILTSSDILERYHDRLQPEKRGGYLRTIHESVKRMGGMMEDVLLLGRVEAGQLEFKPAALDLTALCKTIVEERHKTTTPGTIQLQFDGALEQARGDQSLLRHLLGNLLSNAVKYSAEGSPVSFTVARSGHQAVFTITDRGRGIPAADHERIFQSFRRGSNVGDTPGTGLGLLIVKKAVEMHGGEISFASEEGRGTTFTVVLPLFPTSTDSL